MTRKYSILSSNTALRASPTQPLKYTAREYVRQSVSLALLYTSIVADFCHALIDNRNNTPFVVRLNNLCQGHNIAKPAYEESTTGSGNQQQHTAIVYSLCISLSLIKFKTDEVVVEGIEYGRHTASKKKEAKEQAAKVAYEDAFKKWGAYNV